MAEVGVGVVSRTGRERWHGGCLSLTARNPTPPPTMGNIMLPNTTVLNELSRLTDDGCPNATDD